MVQYSKLTCKKYKIPEESNCYLESCAGIKGFYITKMGFLRSKKKKDGAEGGDEVECGELGPDVDQETIDKCRWLRFGCGPLRVEINPLVTILSAAVIWGMVIWCMIQPNEANRRIRPWMPFITKVFTWLYVGK